MRHCSIVRISIVAVVVVCSLLWAVTGVSVLALALHEHGHHVEDHGHYDALQIALHGHAHESSPDHDHEVTSPLSASRAWWSGHIDALISQFHSSPDSGIASAGTSTLQQVEGRDIRPPSYLLHCVLLT